MVLTLRETMAIWLLPLLTVSSSVALSIPAGSYLARIMNGRYRVPRFLRWFERRLDSGSQNWRQYAVAMLVFNVVMFIVAFAILAMQPCHPGVLNPDEK